MENKLIRETDALPEIKDFKVKKNGNLRMELAYFDDCPDGFLRIHAEKNSHVGVYVSDFSKVNNHFGLEIELEEGATAEVRIAVLCHGEAKKLYTPNVRHLAPHSESFVSCYGIAADDSDLSFKGLSSVDNGAKKSNTRQEAKIILFDKNAKGAASPALVINENDIKAGHGASIGRLNDEHLFYLESRGLGERDAKRLITLGYLKPIVNFYSDKTVKERVAAAIEGGISND